MRYISIVLLLSMTACLAEFDLPPILNLTGLRYYTQVMSIGMKTNKDGQAVSEFGYTQLKCDGSNDCIYLSWTPFIVLETGLPVDGYAIDRRSVDGRYERVGFSDQAEFSDTSSEINVGSVYEYRVYPVHFGGRVYDSIEYMNSIKVLKPGDNLSFVHRSMVNQSVCDDLGKPVGTLGGSDPDNFFRCEYTGLGSSGGFFDYNKHLIVDRFEAGCNFDIGSCSAHDPGDGGSTTDCIGDGDPQVSGITAADDSIFYSRSTASCYIRSGGAWVYSGDASSSEQDLLSNFSADLPPSAGYNSFHVADICSQRSYTFNSLPSVTMKIPKRSDFLAFTHWDKEMLSDTGINNLESGSLIQGNCNTDNGHGDTWDLTYPPLNPEQVSGSGARRVYVTGSAATSNCTSQFGIQDAVGNAYEWSSDQIQNDVGVVSSSDPTNTDLVGIDFSGLTTGVGPMGTYNTLNSSYNFFNIPLGIPLLCVSGCLAEDLNYPTSSVELYGDRYYRSNNPGALWGSLVGGLRVDSNSAGRYRFAFDQGASTVFNAASPRCVGEISSIE